MTDRFKIVAAHALVIASAAFVSALLPDRGWADGATDDELLSQVRSKVVHLMVEGKQGPGETFKIPIHGTGVVIKTDATAASRKYRILTAGHVVMQDTYWAPLGSRRNRNVYVTVETDVAPMQLLPITGVSVSDTQDVAQVVAAPGTQRYVAVRSVDMVAGQTYLAVSWGVDGEAAAERPLGKRVEVEGPDPTDQNLVRLKGEFFPTESGSPLFDAGGNVVAILVMREVSENQSHVGLAVPVAKIIDWINGVRSNPVPEPPPQTLSAVMEQASGLCVFLGKKSALGRADLRNQDAPFGLSVLTAINENVRAETVLASPLSITREAEAINIRSRCPDVRAGRAYYGSIVSVLNPTAQIAIREVIPMNYLDDIFYWGIVDKIVRP